MLPKQGKAKGVDHHQAPIIWNVKGTYLRKRRTSKLWTIKWQKIQIYQQLNLKNKLSKQEQRQNHGYREHFEGCQMGGEYREMGEEVRGLRSTNR